MNETDKKLPRILHVEDNALDVLTLRSVLRKYDLAHELVAVSDGVEAMEYLRRAGRHVGAVRPDLIILDINMPRKNGYEVLSEIKTDSDLRRIPVVMLTTSGSKDDVRKSYDLHANSYAVKSHDFDKFKECVRAIYEFWFERMTLAAE